MCVCLCVSEYVLECINLGAFVRVRVRVLCVVLSNAVA